MKELLKDLTEISAPSGNEATLRTYIRKQIKSFVNEIQVDALGNMIAKKGQVSKKGRRIMVAAHMDEYGVIATHIDEKGFVRFSPLGNMRMEQLPGTKVKFINGVEGVIGVEEDEVDPGLHHTNRMFIDVGVNRRADCKVAVGDAASFVRPFEHVGGKCIAKALDNRAGIAVLIEVIQTLKSSPHEIYFVFTVQEELGSRGAGPAAHQLDCDLGIVVDVTQAEDLPNHPRHSMALGKGPAIKIKDKSSLADPKIVDWMIKTAKKSHIPFQREVQALRGSDLQAIQFIRGGMAVGAISVPCRYVGSLPEMVDLEDVKSTARLLIFLLGKPVVF